MRNPDFFASTRGRIVLALLRRHASISELAHRFGLSIGAVRHHVTALARDGLVEDFADQATATRPAAVYRPTGAALDLVPDGCGRILEAVLRQHRAEEIETEEFLANVGGTIAAEHEPTPDSTHEERIERAIGVFEGFGGIVQRVDLPDGNVRVDGIVCPFHPLIGERPVVCRMAAVMLERMTFVPVDSLCGRRGGPRTRCRLLLRLAPDP